ncbi:DUF4123 domain-containing protein [Modicisalibacter xianhensis]|nr:DUF4123 domain-containing protein [Halomonas xianhensis]
MRWSFSQELTGGTWYWPEEQQAFLLLDGVRIKELPRRLYEWSDGRLEADLLYAGTPWSSVSNVSPWLVQLSGSDDPILQHYLAEGLKPEWGYLIISEASLLEMADHLRRLIQVVHPNGAPMLLRLADPAAITALLSPESSPAQAPWGPIGKLIAPNAVTEEWECWSPVQDEAAPLLPDIEGYHLTDAQLKRLQGCDLRRDTRQIMAFVDQHCPGWLPNLEKSQLYDHLTNIIQEARSLGFSAPRELALLCTLMARLGITTWRGHTNSTAYHSLIDTRFSTLERLEVALNAANPPQSHVTT